MSTEFLWWVVHGLDGALNVFLSLFDGLLWFLDGCDFGSVVYADVFF